ncbi:hypothetical protein IAQ61_004157 [Plenodomus lingam]|uniref:uncharacterized protein n=1 Tax=Leptosphaeria maculans TaxID=5022 RepID=UPI00333225FF|nr:hypothetical protein IAQ61_004157 [Plenodomus lingam]
MTSLIAPGSQANLPPQQPSPPRHVPHGRKRAAESSLEHEQRLSKRFDLLNLDNSTTRLYIPVPGSTDTTTTPTTRPNPSPTPIPTPDPLTFISPPRTPHQRKPRSPPTPRPPPPDTMEVEDTPTRIFIHNLDAELSDLESDEDTPIFLSDIEKHLAKIPRHVLVRPDPKPSMHNQMVLYAVPESLSVEPERDSVRKAIVEARERIRERQGLERGAGAGEGEGEREVGGVGGGGAVQSAEQGVARIDDGPVVEVEVEVEEVEEQEEEQDADAMEID